MPRRLRIWLRRIGIFLGVLFAVLALLVVVLLSPPVRPHLLKEALKRADAVLPGSLDVGHAEWPGLGRLAFENVLWVDEPDTLVAIRSLDLAVDVTSLLQRDLLVREATALGVRADVTAVTARFPSSPETAATGESSGPPAFPRPGAFPGIPSVAVEELRLEAPRVTLPDSSVLKDAVLGGRLDFLRGGPATLELRELHAANPVQGWRVEEGQLRANLLDRTFDGEVRGDVAPDTPFLLTLDDAGESAFRLDLRVWDEQEAGMDLVGRYTLEDNRLRSVSVEGTLRTPSANRLRDLTGWEDFPELPPLEIEMQSTYESDPRNASLSLRSAPHPYVETLRADAVLDGETARLDTFRLDLPELKLDVSGRLEDERVDASGTLDVNGLLWLDALLPGEPMLDRVESRTRFSVEGPLSDLEARLESRSSFARDSLVVERLEVDGIVPLDPGREASVELRMTALDHRLAAQAAVRRGEQTTVLLEPVLVREGTGPDLVLPDAEPGRIELAANGAVEWKSVRIVGDLGRFETRGSLASDQTGSFALDAEWPSLPGVALASLDPALRDSVRRAYGMGRRARVGVQGNLKPGGAIDASGRLRLPGPALVRSLLPPEADVADWTEIEGRFEGGMGTNGDYRARLDLGETSWLDMGLVQVRGQNDRVRVDTVGVVLDGLALSAGGRATADTLNLGGRLNLDDTRLVNRFSPGFLDSLLLDADWSVQGPPRAPEITASLDAAMGGPQLLIPNLEARLHGGPRGLGGNVLLGDASVNGRPVDRLHLVAEAPSLEHPFPASVRFEAAALEGTLLLAAEVDQVDSTLQVAVDTLLATLRRSDLGNTRPFLVSVGSDRIQLDDLDMAGSLGTIQGNGFVSGVGDDLTLAVSLNLPGDPLQNTWPAELWPEGLRLGVEAREKGLQAEAVLEGLDLDGSVDAVVQVNARPDSTVATLRLGKGDRELARGEVRIPGGAALYPPRFTAPEGNLSAELELDAVPLKPAWFGAKVDPGRRVLVEGTVDVSGTAEQPSGRAAFSASFPNWPRLGPYRLSVNAGLEEGGTPEASAVEATLKMTRNAEALVEGMLTLPGPPFSPEDAVTLTLRSEPLTLSDFDALLPPNVHLTGRTRFELEVEGPPDSASLSGSFNAREVQVTLADGSRVLFNSGLSLDGTTARPGVEGKVEVQSGLIRVPDPPKTLHPATGSSILWTVNRDSTGAPPPVSAIAPQPPPADVNVQVTIPSGLWIRGKDLEVELAGDLTLTQRGNLPTVTGTLSAVQGRQVFLGRTFVIQRGQVTFYGEDELDPALDLLLTAQVAETTVQILLEGTARKPKLTLTSEPEMPEGDIMSLLLFGRPLEELDSDQVGLLETRTREVAASLAASQLEARVARQLGLDMLRIETTETGANRVVLGKYLSRNVLLKYEQALESGTRFFVNLEYLLSRHFKVETLVGAQDQSAIEVNWSSEY